MKPLFIVNPASGGGKSGRIFPEIRKTIEKRLGEIDVEYTKRSGHAVELAEKATADGRTLIVAVGGDGTTSDCVDGVLRAKGGDRVEIGLVGQGTGGDFGRTLGIEHRLDSYIDTLVSHKKRRVDVGLARFVGNDGLPRERHFLNILSAGMGGLVDRYVTTTSRALGGKMAYFMASTKALVRSKKANVRCKVTHHGDVSERVIETLMIAVCNGRYFGSGMHVAPMAKPDDGMFEVVSMSGKSKLSYAIDSQKIYEGKHIESEYTTHFSCEKIEIDLVTEDARELFLLDVDGEPLGKLPLSIELLPKAIALRI